MTRAEAISTGLIRGNPQSQIDWECLRKVQHQTIGDAVSAAMKIAVRDNKRMKVYACRWCGRFHVANVKGKKGLKVVEDALELQRLREQVAQLEIDRNAAIDSNAWLRQELEEQKAVAESGERVRLEYLQRLREYENKSFFQKLKDLF